MDSGEWGARSAFYVPWAVQVVFCVYLAQEVEPSVLAALWLLLAGLGLVVVLIAMTRQLLSVTDGADIQSCASSERDLPGLVRAALRFLAGALIGLGLGWYAGEDVGLFAFMLVVTTLEIVHVFRAGGFPS